MGGYFDLFSNRSPTKQESINLEILQRLCGGKRVWNQPFSGKWLMAVPGEIDGGSWAGAFLTVSQPRGLRSFSTDGLCGLPWVRAMPPKKDDKPAGKGAPPPADPGSGKQLKIFIHELDGYLGNVLGERAKRHAAEGEHPIICGSLINPRNKPTWADEVVGKDDILGLKKALLASDVIVYDLTSSPKEATSALKILLKYDYAENPEDETEKVMIGVSSLLSWAGNTVGMEDGADGAGEMAVITTAMAEDRKPHPNYKAQVRTLAF
jgi:hypothetical protein